MGKISNDEDIILLFLKFFFQTLRIIFHRSCSSLSTVFLVFSIVFLIQIPNAFPTQVTVGWDENPETNIAGYKLYYGTSSGNYTNTVDVGFQTQYTLTNLQEGVTYFFAVAAYNTSLNESAFSKELVFKIDLPNRSPSTPPRPSGPASGYLNSSYNFSTSSSDPDGDPLTFQFDWGDGTTSSWGSSSWAHSWVSPESYCVKAKAKDPHGATSEWSNCLNINITERTHTIIASADSNGSIAPSGVVTVSNRSNKTFSIQPGSGYHVLDVRVDNKSLGALNIYTFENVTQSHTITASFALTNQPPVNQPPIAKAGSDQTVEERNTCALNGLGSKDPEGKTLQYTWNQTGGINVQLSNPNKAQSTFIAPGIGSDTEKLTFKLTVTDNGGLKNTDTCSVYITKSKPRDSDDDGVPDDQDAFPFDPSETEDNDKDGVGNNADKDDDNDGMTDVWENKYGLDPLFNDASEDADGDGVTNLEEFIDGTDPMIPEENSAPDPPEIQSPDADDVVTLTPTLKIDGFYDPDAEDVHTETGWKIYRKSDNACVLDITSASALTSLQVPNLILDEETTYRWKARFYDSHGAPSEWSDIAIFSTEVNRNDLDNNGIPDNQEIDAPSDMDQDGVLDEDEDTIKSVKTNGGDTQMGVSFEGSDTVVEIQSIASEDPNTPVYADQQSSNQPEYFPLGLISFKLAVDTPGDQAEVTVYLSEAAPEESIWYKYDPIEGIWMDYSDNAVFSSDRRSVKLFLEDGGTGDTDGIANGIIVDPSGVGAASVSAVSGGGGDGGSSNSGGCFIHSAAYGSSKNRQAVILQANRMIHVFAILLLLLILVVAKNSISLKVRQILKDQNLNNARIG